MPPCGVYVTSSYAEQHEEASCIRNTVYHAVVSRAAWWVLSPLSAKVRTEPARWEHPCPSRYHSPCASLRRSNMPPPFLSKRDSRTSKPSFDEEAWKQREMSPEEMRFLAERQALSRQPTRPPLQPSMSAEEFDQISPASPPPARSASYHAHGYRGPPPLSSLGTMQSSPALGQHSPHKPPRLSAERKPSRTNVERSSESSTDTVAVPPQQRKTSSGYL